MAWHCAPRCPPPNACPPSPTLAGAPLSDPVAVEALDIFLSIVGAEAGHMALRSLASGGVFICGGIFPRVRVFRPEGRWMLDALRRPLSCCSPLPEGPGGAPGRGWAGAGLVRVLPP